MVLPIQELAEVDCDGRVSAGIVGIDVTFFPAEVPKSMR